MIPIIILAGGYGTRLKQLTKSTPKSLILINEVPFVIHQLLLLKKSGFLRIHFCLGHLGKKIEDEVKNHPIYQSLNISFSYDGENQLGTGGAIKNTIDKMPDYFFVTYGDSYLLTDYQKILNYFFNNIESPSDSLMTVFKNNDEFDRSNVDFNGKKIIFYSKNCSLKNMNYIDFGLSIISKNSFRIFNKKCIFDLSEYISFQVTNNSLIGYEVTKRFYEIGSLEGIKDLKKIL